MKTQARHTSGQRGFALVFAMFAILILGMLAATLMCTSQWQTLTSLNYRTTTQSRYAAEADVQTTMDWLANGYTPPTSFTSYNTNADPVTYNGSPVVLSAVSGVSSNYPDAAVVSAYRTALSNSLSGVPNATFATYATLLRMNPNSGASWLGGGGVMQTWQITSVGSVGNTASVQVVATYERTGTPIFNYTVATTSTGCKSIDFAGTDYTDSYNSNNGAYGGTNVSASGGNIATNGNVTLGSGANIKGTINAPNVTAGACPDGITSSGTYAATKQIAANSIDFPLPWGCSSTPCYPSPLPPTTAQDVSTSCGSVSGCTSKGTTVIDDNGTKTTVNQYSLSPGDYGNLKIDNADVVYLSAGTYNVNSLDFAKDGQLVITSGPVIINVAGQGFCASGCTGNVVVNAGGLSGWNLCNNGLPGNVGVYGAANCPTGAPVGGIPTSGGPISGVPANLQIVYAGSAQISTTGAPVASVIYAPNAAVPITGAAVGYYGSVVSNTFTEGSKAPVHYDDALQNELFQVGNYKPVGGFSWSKY